jgi:AraC-like DNA-binding protein
VPVRILHQLLEGVIEVTGDQDWGLKAAREWAPGDGGALDHALISASTVHAAIEAAARYVRLLTDSLEIRLLTVGPEAFLRHEHLVSMPRAAQDFESGVIYRGFHCVWASGANANARVLMEHPAPADITEYARTFDPFPIEFGAPFSGFAFDAACLDAPLVSADPGLHRVVCNHADLMLEALSRARQFTRKVRQALAGELDGGTPSIARVASHMGMSSRTLERKLEREGAKFSELLEEMRRELAIRYVGNQRLELTEIACLLGFSQAACFSRAFKRWTGETPLSYRRASRQARFGGPRR